MSTEVERHQPTELERQAHWEQDANALAARYAGIVSLEDLSPEERVLSLLSLIPAYSAIVEEARDTIERLNEELDALRLVEIKRCVLAVLKPEAWDRWYDLPIERLGGTPRYLVEHDRSAELLKFARHYLDTGYA